MTFYRAFFTKGGHVFHHYQFHAEKDEIAIEAAKKVFDACCEACDELEIWSGARCITCVTEIEATTSKSLVAKWRQLLARSNDVLIRAENVSKKARESSQMHNEI